MFEKETVNCETVKRMKGHKKGTKGSAPFAPLMLCDLLVLLQELGTLGVLLTDGVVGAVATL